MSLSLNKIYWSHKTETSYACVAIGNNYTYDVWEKKNHQFVRTPSVMHCASDECVFLELKSWGKPIVLKQDAVLHAINQGVIEVRDC